MGKKIEIDYSGICFIVIILSLTTCGMQSERHAHELRMKRLDCTHATTTEPEGQSDG